MSGIMDLETLLKDMHPVLDSQDYVFCSLNQELNNDLIALNPLCMLREKEGITLILEKAAADETMIDYEGLYKKITLEVHSSLEAVGLTAAFSKALTDVNISANVVAGYYHDHIFIPKEQAEAALAALMELTRK